MFDAIIVGARCAGSPTAMLLARQGHRVLLVDRARFPSDTISTHFIQLPGVARLSRWGLLERLMATGCPPITSGLLEVDGMEIPAPFEGAEIAPFTVAPRRTVLDKLLIDAARDAGAEVREGFYLEDVVLDDGRVQGVVGRDADGSRTTETAKIVIGADGRNSPFAKLANIPFLQFHPTLGCAYYGYWSGDFSPTAEFRIKKDRTLIKFPTHDACVIIAAWPPEKFREVRKAPELALLDAYADVEGMPEKIEAGARKEKLVGIADAPTFVRPAAGPGWALVGDAAYHKDPTPADGISDAFRGADYLAKALDDAFSGRIWMEDALRVYEERCNESTARSLPPTLEISSYEGSPSERANAFLALGMWHGEELAALAATTPQASGAI